MNADVLTLDHLKTLLRLIPTEEESDRIADFISSQQDAPLGTAERFMFILRRIPRLEQRLETWMFSRRFESDCVNDLGVSLNVLHNAVKQVRENKLIKSLLANVLAIGNHLNGGTFRGKYSLSYLPYNFFRRGIRI